VEHLTAGEWSDVERAFSDNRDPVFDAALTEEYRQLYQRILELTPRPLKSLLEGDPP
jgi:hypothetical protein